ncbi:hypothetical protein BDN72DRAFT_92833 [Pluteus cervinus]|uniref:Uncharacterized protein n=1 Tax=Pluteus cervinus TaxID=181527 RepID=A0ACD3ANN4_9AGAR|nr:hypothetical protein BDN72DRAFT_92833 [Pluteus cervinus]
MTSFQFCMASQRRFLRRFRPPLLVRRVKLSRHGVTHIQPQTLVNVLRSRPLVCGPAALPLRRASPTPPELCTLHFSSGFMLLNCGHIVYGTPGGIPCCTVLQL